MSNDYLPQLKAVINGMKLEAVASKLFLTYFYCTLNHNLMVLSCLRHAYN